MLRRLWNTLSTTGLAILLTALIVGSRSRPVYSAAVTDWNVITAQAIVTALGAGRPAPPTILDFALVHVAIHDAVQAFDKRFEPYHVTIANASGSPVAAVATAAHDVLLNLSPVQAATLNTQYNDYLTSHGLTVNDPGVVIGQQAAAGILAYRANDGAFPRPSRLSPAGPIPASGAQRHLTYQAHHQPSRRELHHG